MSLGTGNRSISRRALVGGAIGAVTALAPAARLAAQEPGVASVRNSIRVITGLGGNIVFRSSDSGCVLVDSGAAERTPLLLDTLSTIRDGRPMLTLFNTHWHLDQVGSNAVIREMGVDIIAHEKTLAHLSTPYFLPDEDRYQQPLPRGAHPNLPFYTDGSHYIDGQLIRYGYLLEAHTDGDIYVRFDDDNVIAAGDAISPLRDPELDWFGGGWLGGRIDSLQLLLDISDDDTRFIPSYGPTVDRAYVQTEHELMLALYDIMWERVRSGESAADIYRSGALDALSRTFDDPQKILYDTHKSMWAHYNTLSPDIV